MKPTKNRYFCVDAGRAKMLFKSEGSAKRFMEFNSDDIEEKGGRIPVRAYFCVACGGWHITSQPEDSKRKSKTEKYFEKNELIIDAVKHKNKLIEEVEECMVNFLYEKGNKPSATVQMTLLYEKIIGYMNTNERMRKQLWHYIPVIEMFKQHMTDTNPVPLENKILELKDSDKAAYCDAKCIINRVNKKISLLRSIPT